MWKNVKCKNDTINTKVNFIGRIFSGRKIWLLFLALLFFCVIFMSDQETYEDVPVKEFLETRTYDKTWRHLSKTEKEKLSVLGRILYLEEERPPQKNKEFLILFWRCGQYLKSRHLNQFTTEEHNPLETCSVKNCNISFEDDDLAKADLVLFHLHRITGVSDLPKERKNLRQFWTFLTDESPYHTFIKSKVKLTDFNGKFNWSMSYRMDSDIPVPYGRTRKFFNNATDQQPIVPYKRRDRLVTVLGSNCGGKNHRWNYVDKLKKLIDVDVYGGCGNKTACPGHFKSDCPAIDNYLFYLSFENSDCKEYITEKVFWNAYHKNSIPIVMGYNRKSYEKLLPPSSFLHVDDFATPKDLADYILFLNSTGEYQNYFQWKNQYEVLNEHGYFKSKSYHICRICEALNYNHNGSKIYDHLEKFWDKSKDCSVR